VNQCVATTTNRTCSRCYSQARITLVTVGTRHDEAELLAAAVDAVLDGGLGELTFGRLGKRIGVADRTLVYYFTNKQQLLESVLGVLAGKLLEQLGEAFGDERRSRRDLLKTAYPLLTVGEADRVFALWFEFAGQATSGQEPQRSLAGVMIEMWIDWLTDRIDARTRQQRRAEAVTVLAILDGALLLHHLGHTEAGQLAIDVATKR
jgi:AcrR family transcriptional regulator